MYESNTIPSSICSLRSAHGRLRATLHSAVERRDIYNGGDAPPRALPRGGGDDLLGVDPGDTVVSAREVPYGRTFVEPSNRKQVTMPVYRTATASRGPVEGGGRGLFERGDGDASVSSSGVSGGSGQITAKVSEEGAYGIRGGVSTERETGPAERQGVQWTRPATILQESEKVTMRRGETSTYDVTESSSAKQVLRMGRTNRVGGVEGGSGTQLTEDAAGGRIAVEDEAALGSAERAATASTGRADGALMTLTAKGATLADQGGGARGVVPFVQVEVLATGEAVRKTDVLSGALLARTEKLILSYTSSVDQQGPPVEAIILSNPEAVAWARQQGVVNLGSQPGQVDASVGTDQLDAGV